MSDAFGISARKHGQAVRAFFAVPLPEALRAGVSQQIASLHAATDGDAVRWVRADALHLTLRFLGNVGVDDVPALTAAVGEALADVDAFAVKLGAPVAFPAPRRPRGVVLEASPEEPLAAVAERIASAIEPQGFAPERRKFRAHVTLGRLRSRRLPALELPAPDPAEWWIDRVVLFQSELARDGARHRVLETIPLGSATAAAPSSHP